MISVLYVPIAFADSAPYPRVDPGPSLAVEVERMRQHSSGHFVPSAEVRPESGVYTVGPRTQYSNERGIVNWGSVAADALDAAEREPADDLVLVLEASPISPGLAVGGSSLGSLWVYRPKFARFVVCDVIVLERPRYLFHELGHCVLGLPWHTGQVETDVTGSTTCSLIGNEWMGGYGPVALPRKVALGWVPESVLWPADAPGLYTVSVDNTGLVWSGSDGRYVLEYSSAWGPTMWRIPAIVPIVCGSTGFDLLKVRGTVSWNIGKMPVSIATETEALLTVQVGKPDPPPVPQATLTVKITSPANGSGPLHGKIMLASMVESTVHPVDLRWTVTIDGRTSTIRSPWDAKGKHTAVIAVRAVAGELTATDAVTVTTK
jgi:hypothetical protein